MTQNRQLLAGFIDKRGVLCGYTSNKHHYNKQNTPAYFLTNSVRTLSGDDKGRVWIGTMEGLLILEPETGTFRICRFFS